MPDPPPPESNSPGSETPNIASETPVVATETPAVATETQDAVSEGAAGAYPPLPKPPSGGKQVMRVYELLGLKIIAHRAPIHDRINAVWKSRPQWATTELRWTEIPPEDRAKAEEELREELERQYPLPGTTAERIRRCRGWLAGYLLSEKHRARGKRRGPPAREMHRTLSDISPLDSIL